MYLCDRDLDWAIKCGRLIVDPPPQTFGATSIDLHLDAIDHAKIWDIEKFSKNNDTLGHPLKELRVGKFNHEAVGAQFYKPPSDDPNELVFRRGESIIVRPHGFLLWQTHEKVGTPEKGADLICFVDGKSTRARTGLLVHMTAPTLHAAWWGKITLEIANLGPFDIVLEPGDVISQIVVARISSPTNKKEGAIAIGQGNVTGSNSNNTKPKKPPKKKPN